MVPYLTMICNYMGRLSLRTHGAAPKQAVVARALRLARGTRVVFERSDVSLPAGTITALIGPNGSGKSTLLGALGGLIDPVGGTLDVLGTSPAAAQRRIAYVLQATAEGAVLPVTVREVITMARFARRGMLGRLRSEDRAAVAAAMDRMEVTDLADRHVRDLSGGQRQRVLVAQGLAQEAELLLLDEPVTGLDAPSRRRILEALAEERADGRTVVVATHDLEDARRADEVVLLAGGVVAAGAPEVVLTRDNLAAAYSGRLVNLEGRTVVDDEHRHGAQHFRR